MKVLFDTHVILDFLLRREPFSSTAARLVARVEGGEIEGLLCATTVTTTHYLLERALGRDQALAAIRKLLSLFTVAGVDGKTLSLALELSFSDFEDAVLHEAARLSGAKVIVTRNAKDFQAAELTVETPEELEASVAASES